MSTADENRCPDKICNQLFYCPLERESHRHQYPGHFAASTVQPALAPAIPKKEDFASMAPKIIRRKKKKKRSKKSAEMQDP